MSLCGPLRWRRRVGRCPQGGPLPQVAPLDAALGGQPHQRTRGERQCWGCACAVFVPFAPAARVLGWSCGGLVSPRAVWGWVQASGHHAMARLQEALEAVAKGDAPPQEPLAAALAALPLALGAEGVMVPLRPTGGAPTGKRRWRAINVGVLARLRQHRTRLGHGVTRLQHRRLVAGWGDREALRPRRWGEAVRQGILQASHGVWLSDGGRGVGRLVEERFASRARGIVDVYRAAQQLWKSAAAWWDGRTTQARRWCGWARHRLRHGMADGVRAARAEALDVEGLPETARETLQTG
jgi:hypothetical protein